MDLGGWLRNFGLERYESTFAENAIDTDVLPEMTESDFEKLRIPLGDRKRLIRAIQATLASSHNVFAATSAGEDAQDGQINLAAAERRHLSVMLCDLVGSTALSARLDPEDLRSVMDTYYLAGARICRNYDGFTAQFRGDGILAYFGYPRAHEDDAERTVRAALEIIDEVARLETPAGEPLAVRIGIATGLVVVGDISGDTIVGDTPNLAARLQSLGEPGMIVVGSSTRRLLGDLFQFRDLGRHEVKGIAEPVAAWAVTGVSSPASRFEAIRVVNPADFIGRKDEIDFLLERQRLSWEGEGQVVLISGEPGIGKSRLAGALAERIVGGSYTRLTYQCSLYHTNSALHPFIAQFERASGFKEGDSPEQRIDKLAGILARSASPLEAVVPLFAALLSIPTSERWAPLALSAPEQRRRTLAALLDHLEGLARQQPILLLFEDAHWADATSLELLDMIVARAPELPILAMLTFRPEFEPPWADLPNVGSLTLGRLERGDVECMAARVAGGRALPAEVMRGIVGKTDGNPLFVEELTKAVLESGIMVDDAAEGYRLEGPLPPLAIPATLRDSLMARLDRLESMKEIGQVGAAIGREFSYSLLRAVAGRDEALLANALAQLEEAELVFRRGEPPEAVYSFKHALVQEAAYESLLKSSRRRLHRRIAGTIEEKFAGIVAGEPEIVAHHFTEAGLLDRAAEYWLKAGKLALSRSANAEALNHLRRGIGLIDLEAPSPQRTRTELEFYLALGPAMAAIEGYAAPGTMKVFSYARKLLGDGGTLTEQMTVLWGAFLAHNMRAEHDDALEVAKRCLTLAERHEHSGMSVLANRFIGQTLNVMGALVDARLYLERTIDLCAANEKAIGGYRGFGIDDRVSAMFNLSRALLLLGYPDRSAVEAEKAVSRARNLGFPFTTALALSHGVLNALLRGDLGWAAIHVDGAIANSVMHELRDTEQMARFVKGSLLAQNGDFKNGLDMMRKALAAQSKAVQGYHPLYFSLYLGHIAAAHMDRGEHETGLDLLNGAIRAVRTTNERFFEAELHRLRGNMLLALGKKDEAESELLDALKIAQHQQTRWWELRVATSLARHWRDEGRSREAYSIVQPVYAWFVEGFDTTTLRDAKALLDATSGE